MNRLRSDSYSIKDEKPIIPRDLLKGQVDDYNYVFNPRGRSGVIVLDGPALSLFTICEKAESFSEIFQRAQQLGLNEEKTSAILEYLATVEVIEICKDKFIEFTPRPKKSKRFTVWLQMTDDCNLNCVYCYIKSNPRYMSYEIAEKALKNTITSAKLSGYPEVLVKFAGGEPLLCWELIDRIIPVASTYAHELGVKARFHALTNGTILPEGIYKYLDSDMLSLSFSIDGVGAYHDLQRSYRNKNGSFKIIDRNLRTLIERGKRPYLLTTLTSLNLDGLIELVEYCQKRELPSRLSFYKYVDRHSLNLIPETDHLILKLKELYAWMMNHLPKQSLYDFHRLGEINLLSPKRKNCGIGINSATISCDGDINICQYEMSISLGNILTDDIIKAITNQGYYDIENTKPANIPGCDTCPWRFSCAGGCPLHNKLANGKINSNSPYCAVFQQVMPSLLDLHAKQIITLIPKERRK